MPIDMDNMLPGFSPQLMCANPVKINPNTGVVTTVVATNPLREAEVLDVGIVVTNRSTGAYNISFGSVVPSGNDGTATPTHFVSAAEVEAGATVGTVLRVSDGTLSWHTTADTEDERRLAKGSHITILNTDSGNDG